MICECGKQFYCNVLKCTVQDRIERCICPDCLKKCIDSLGYGWSAVDRIMDNCFSGTKSEHKWNEICQMKPKSGEKE